MNKMSEDNITQEQRVLEKMSENDKKFIRSKNKFCKEPYYMTYSKKIKENNKE